MQHPPRGGKGLRGPFGKLGCQGDGRLQRRPLRHGPRCESPLDCFCRRKFTIFKNQFLGTTKPNQSRQQPGRTAIRTEPRGGIGQAITCGFVDQHNIAHQGHRYAAAGGHAVNADHDRLRHGQQHVLSLMPFVGDGNEFFGIIAEGFEFLEIPAETEHRAVGAKHHGTDVIILLGLLCRREEIQRHLPRERITRFRVIETDDRNRSVALIIHVRKFQSNLHSSQQRAPIMTQAKGMIKLRALRLLLRGEFAIRGVLP